MNLGNETLSAANRTDKYVTIWIIWERKKRFVDFVTMLFCSFISTSNETHILNKAKRSKSMFCRMKSFQAN